MFLANQDHIVALRITSTGFSVLRMGGIWLSVSKVQDFSGNPFNPCCACVPRVNNMVSQFLRRDYNKAYAEVTGDYSKRCRVWLGKILCIYRFRTMMVDSVSAVLCLPKSKRVRSWVPW